MENEELLTIPEAARELGAAVSTVYNALAEGRLASVARYGRNLILRADLEAYRARTRPDGLKPRGRPRGSRNQDKSQDRNRKGGGGQ